MSDLVLFYKQPMSGHKSYSEFCFPTLLDEQRGTKLTVSMVTAINLFDIYTSDEKCTLLYSLFAT